MTAIIIGMEAAGRTRQGIAPAQPCATRDSAQIEPTCVAGETHPHGIAGVRELVTVRIATLVAGERIVATIRCSKRPNSPASFQSAAARFRSVIPAKLLPSGRWTAGSVLPFWRCFRLLYAKLQHELSVEKALNPDDDFEDLAREAETLLARVQAKKDAAS